MSFDLDLSFIRPGPDEELSSDSSFGPGAKNEERQFFEDGRETYSAEQAAQRELDEKLKNLKQNRRIKKNFSKQVINYLWWFSLGCLIILFLEGFSPKISIALHYSESMHFKFRSDKFHIDDTPLTTLIGSTAVSAIGLVAIVLRGLFNGKEDKTGEKSTAESSKNN
ncbi:hypothetical protein predicted by Glimmer/Critica [Acetobacter senegalensis]|uniref:Uncharacterized protein n=1 Tax=Acetobacter senegalensis TaxID=446692 RepID=A0A0U5B6N4_9PROT|nr:hypothetical protein [Acetobacter senegalensis]CEF40197.1 hypothetical protein predicted by Glimmer/Critica [Acetobacter senegalensis]